MLQKPFRAKRDEVVLLLEKLHTDKGRSSRKGKPRSASVEGENGKKHTPPRSKKSGKNNGDLPGSEQPNPTRLPASSFEWKPGLWEIFLTKVLFTGAVDTGSGNSGQIEQVTKSCS
jgi:hypothetical protein